jgi:hypothetical protein
MVRLEEWTRLCFVLFATLLAQPSEECFGGGVTVITHGHGGNADGWITAMADAIPNYNSFPGTNFTIYKITLTTDGNNNYFYQWGPTNLSLPAATDSGEIIVKLDWSQMAGGSLFNYDVSTSDVAGIASWVLLQTNTLSALGGHALAEFPLHLIGHSRGGSLVAEISRLLGTNGVWVDHLTTLDPHPLNNDGFIDPILITDAPVNTYENVLFHDNYWEDINIYPWGEDVAGAYVRPLDSSLKSDPSGYGSNYHSDIHLWYHGSVNLNTPATYNVGGDTATIDEMMRTNWWVPYEVSGLRAGFYYSLVGRGNRLSDDEPLGPGYSAISDGYNKSWDLGAGVGKNRTAVSANNGEWPNIIKLNITGTNTVTEGESLLTRFYYQYGGTARNVTCQFYFDRDFNPFGSNSLVTSQFVLTNTGVSAVAIVNASLNTTNTPHGTYAVYGKISDGIHIRYLYAPEPVQVLSRLEAPVLTLAALNPAQFRISVNGVLGQNIVLESSTDLKNWAAFATNALLTAPWIYTNNSPTSIGSQFYRAVLRP